MVGFKGKVDALSFYHNNFDDITFREGVGLPGDDGAGFYPGSNWGWIDFVSGTEKQKSLSCNEEAPRILGASSFRVNSF